MVDKTLETTPSPRGTFYTALALALFGLNKLAVEEKEKNPAEVTFEPSEKTLCSG